MSDIVDDILGTTAEMAAFCNVPMVLWGRHSNACLKAAVEITALRERVQELEKAADRIATMNLPTKTGDHGPYVGAAYLCREIARAALPTPPKEAGTWKKKVSEERARKGRDLTLEELIDLARPYRMTEAEIEAQRQSWMRQDMD